MRWRQLLATFCDVLTTNPELATIPVQTVDLHVCTGCYIATATCTCTCRLVDLEYIPCTACNTDALGIPMPTCMVPVAQLAALRFFAVKTPALEGDHYPLHVITVKNIYDIL